MDIQSLQDFVMLAGDRPVTDSRKVAKQFGKRHREVLRAYRNKQCSEGFARRNFAQCFEINSLANGKPEPVIQMTKDGFMFLVMGFTGAKAAAIKEAFIEAFNRMAEFIQRNAMGAWERYNAALLEYRHDAATASRAGSVLCDWGRGGRKARHVTRLEQLHPQMQLLPLGVVP
jgi:Rha family phage regulatory protein